MMSFFIRHRCGLQVPTLFLEGKIMMRFGLSVYGTVFSMGLNPASGRPVIRPQQLMDQALATGLEGVELPASLIQGENVAAVAHYAQERGLFITLAASGYNPVNLI